MLFAAICLNLITLKTPCRLVVEAQSFISRIITVCMSGLFWQKNNSFFSYHQMIMACPADTEKSFRAVLYYFVRWTWKESCLCCLFALTSKTENSLWIMKLNQEKSTNCWCVCYPGRDPKHSNILSESWNRFTHV